MAAANEALEEDRLAGRLEEKQLENVQEGESHIEMVWPSRVAGF